MIIIMGPGCSGILLFLVAVAPMATQAVALTP